MQIYDLSHSLNNNMPIYPGSYQPRFLPSGTIQNNGYRETRLIINSHQGTHIDAPAHMIEDGKTLDQLPVNTFIGNALIVPVPENTRFIEKNFLLPYEKALTVSEFVLFRTGWSKFWGTSQYFEGFPTLASSATKWLLKFPLKGIGFDTISADPVENTNWPNHYLIFNKELIIIENLVFPVELTDTEGAFSCLPLHIENADGSPVRAVFIVGGF